MASRLVQKQARPRDPFQQYLAENRPDLLIPEGKMVPIGLSRPWSPSNEDVLPPGVPCPSCGGTIARRSTFVCLKCPNGSGYEPELGEQRYINPAPSRDRVIRTKPKPKKARKKGSR